jgi:aminopeptidase N
LAVQAALRFIRGGGNLQTENVLGNDYIEAMRAVLNHSDLDAAFKELVLTLPSETYISEQLESVDPQLVHAVREAMKLQLATSLFNDWQTSYEQNRVLGAYSPDAISSGKRALSGMALSMLCLAAQHQGTTVWPGKALQAFKDAHNMTDRFNALIALVGSGHELATTALAQFHALFKNEDLVIDKWFGLQASAPDRSGHILPIVRQLMQHADFNLRNPNRARSLIFSYCSANPGGFHRTDAAGYVFWSERVIELDAINPQVAARLARAMDRWRKLAEPYRQAAKAAIERVAAKSDLSNDVREVVTRALAE